MEKFVAETHHLLESQVPHLGLMFTSLSSLQNILPRCWGVNEIGEMWRGL